MERVVFLDRDGTLNEEVHYLHRTSDLKILPGVPEALRMLRRPGTVWWWLPIRREWPEGIMARRT